jgi:hypothetical protein
MTLEEEFAEIIQHNLFLLDSQIIVPYVVDCFYTLSAFIAENIGKSVHFTYDNTDLILQGFYKIGIENCQKKYDYYNSILNFKSQYQIDRQLMIQIRQKYYNYALQNSILATEPKIVSITDKEFYIKKYKFYNSFKITLS